MAISIGDALLKIGVDTRGVDKELQGLGNKLKKHQKAIGLGMLAAGGAIVAAGAMSVKAYANMGDEVAKMAKRTGFSTEALSELRHAAEISGSSLGSLEKGVKKMSMSISDARDGLATYTREFDKIGVSVEELDALSPEEQFFKIAEAIASLEDPTQRAASAQKILGRAGTELLPLFAEGAEGMAKLRQEAHELGIVFDEEAAKKAEEFTDTMTRLNSSVEGVKFGIADALIPIIEPLLRQVTDITKAVGDWVKENKELAQVVAISGVLMIGLGALLLILPKLQLAVVALTIKMAVLTIATKVAAIAQGIFAASVGVSIGLLAALVAGLAMVGYGIFYLVSHQQAWNKVTAATNKLNEAIKKSQGEVNDEIVEAAKEYIALREAYGQVRPEEEARIQNLRDMIATHEEYQVKLVEWTKTAQEQHQVKLEQWAEERDARKDIIELQEEELDLLRQRITLMLEQYEWDKRTERLRAERLKALRGEANLYGELLIEYYQAIKARVAMGIASREETEWLGQNGKALEDYIDKVEQQTDATLTKTGALKDQTAEVRELTEAELSLGSATNLVAGAFSSATDAMKGWTVAYSALTGKPTYYPPDILTKKAWGKRAEKQYPPEQVAAYKKEFGEDWERYITKWMPLQGITPEQARLSERMSRKYPGGVPSEAIPEYEREWERLRRIPAIEHPYYEQGGIAMRPVLAHIAEKQPEAVIPLDKLEGMIGGYRTADIRIYLNERVLAEALGQPLVDIIKARQGIKI